MNTLNCHVVSAAYYSTKHEAFTLGMVSRHLQRQFRFPAPPPPKKNNKKIRYIQLSRILSLSASSSEDHQWRTARPAQLHCPRVHAAAYKVWENRNPSRPLLENRRWQRCSSKSHLGSICKSKTSLWFVSLNLICAKINKNMLTNWFSSWCG